MIKTIVATIVITIYGYIWIILWMILDDRRKFRSQTYDNMQRWKSSQRREVKK